MKNGKTKPFQKIKSLLLLRQMPRKKSIKIQVNEFVAKADQTLLFFNQSDNNFSEKEYREWCADYSIIRLYRCFESLMLEALICAINSDASETISEISGFKFPKHLTVDICKYLIIGKGYFDFKGREGLIKKVKEFVPEKHWLVKVLKKKEYREALEQISPLRNFACHDSKRAKDSLKAAIGGERLPDSVGSWLRKEGRFEKLVTSLKKMARALLKESEK